MLELAVIDRDELSRNGLKSMVGSLPNWELSGAYAAVSDFEKALERKHVQAVVLNDGCVSHGDLWGVLTGWRDRYPNLIVVILSQKLSHRYLQRLFAHGVQAFIYRADCKLTTLLACMESARKCERYISPRASTDLYLRQDRTDALGLKAMDMDVLHCLNRGLTTQEIALNLQTTERTVHRSRSRLRSALKVTINERLIPAAIEYGLIRELEE